MKDIFTETCFSDILRISQNSHIDLNNDKMFPRLYTTLLQEVPVKYKFSSDVACKMTHRNERYKYPSPWQIQIHDTNKSETKKSHFSGHIQNFLQTWVPSPKN